MLTAMFPNITDFIEAWALSAIDCISSGSTRLYYRPSLTGESHLLRYRSALSVVGPDGLPRRFLDEVLMGEELDDQEVWGLKKIGEDGSLTKEETSLGFSNLSTNFICRSVNAVHDQLKERRDGSGQSGDGLILN